MINMTNESNTPGWSNKVPPNPGNIVPAGTPMGKLELPYGGPLFFFGKTDEVSDGYHTFGELYDHRITLWIALCKSEVKHNKASFVNAVWRTRTHSDGSVWDGWFLLGITRQNDEQITYHLPLSKWDDCGFARILNKAPDFDGHTSADVLQRIANL